MVNYHFELYMLIALLVSELAFVDIFKQNHAKVV